MNKFIQPKKCKCIPPRYVCKSANPNPKVVNSSNQSYKLIQPKLLNSSNQSYEICFQPQSSNHIQPTKFASLIQPSCKSMGPEVINFIQPKLWNANPSNPTLWNSSNQPSCRSIQPRLYKLHPTKKSQKSSKPSCRSIKPRLQTSSKVVDFHPSCAKSPFLLSLSSSSSLLFVVVVVFVSEELFWIVSFDFVSFLFLVFCFVAVKNPFFFFFSLWKKKKRKKPPFVSGFIVNKERRKKKRRE